MLPAGRLEAIDRVVGRPVRLALHVMAGQARDEIVERREVRRVVDVAQLFPTPIGRVGSRFAHDTGRRTELSPHASSRRHSSSESPLLAE